MCLGVGYCENKKRVDVKCSQVKIIFKKIVLKKKLHEAIKLIIHVNVHLHTLNKNKFEQACYSCVIQQNIIYTN